MAENNNAEGREKQMSGFGHYVWELMAKRRITRQKDLITRLEKVGFEVRAQNLSNWFHGTQPPTEYLRALIEGLELDEEEEAELLRKFTWEARCTSS